MLLRSVFGKTLRDQRLVLLGWAIGIVAVGVGYASFYPAVNSPDMTQALQSFPKGMLDALGFVDVTSAAGYLGATSYGLLGPALVIVFGAAVGAGAIAGEEEAGRLDLTLAHPVSRWSALVQRLGAIAVQMLVVCLLLGLALVAISGPAELGDIGPANLLGASVQLALLGILFGALALAVGAATGRRGVAYAVVAVVAVGGFFGHTLGPTVGGLAWLDTISPFRYFSGGLPLRNGFQAADGVVLLVASLVLVALCGLRFDRRDIAV
jgi:ABC-2 type transport system permease protein